MEHYFTQKPSTKSNKMDIEFNFIGNRYIFTTDNGVFSKEHIDTGSIILLKHTLKNIENDVFSCLDIGCGYGVIATVVKTHFPLCKITLSDINERAIELSVSNLKQNNIKGFNIVKSDLFTSIKGTFDIIISNPPIRAGKKVIYELYRQSYEYLNDNGKFFCVIMTKHGAKSTLKELQSIFTDVKCLAIESGYRVYMCTKK